jgi:hypothetical protein
MPKRTRTKRTKGTKRKGQFLWNMKGCSRKKCMSGGATLAYDPNRPSQLGVQNPIDYPKAYTGQKGGCGSCYGGGSVMRGGNKIIKGGRRRRTQRGGRGGVPSPLVGNAWSSNPSSWPQGNGSEIPLNTYEVQPGYPGGSERAGSFGPPKVGGARRRTRRQKQRGGGVGLGGIFGGIGSDLSNAYHTLKGIPPNPSPNPWQGQYSGQDNLGYVNFAGTTRALPVNVK